ncbi:P-loop containing nucleoside triphosphate hydrolase protein [Rozella allomycis CSF55]|uniref:Nucleolar GTP-binding protein 1 n=1 Tax=Rozella allomycis (strain CSF55) TaxID=988480 RepID=A0A075AXN9_ROZAC|nr:NOG domain-containing protein [Rozella allomycis CSF55]RKP18884.1 P-loop containing nucleoside triphosphate hydrolase protein [Rozella allomycis CSF55]|eukprot:EPZ35012.1 NOG domain-containing protein [Rozella allomycis CSF55]
MSLYNFKKIQVVPTSADFIDIVLSKTNRKTPTVIHPNYKISRIRKFYMRKVKFTQDAFDEKLNQILTSFPKLDEVHPFYADLMNVLYDRDHYKLALGQINTARHLIEQVGKDYVRLLKFGDSLYRCKQLKRAALGRMATIMKKQKDSLVYLEQIRQHLARLPSIDPNTRTLLLCGYPNVGKSSFMNKLTRAEVDVQPYAFTTKSLFVGHMDYNYLRWQVIDTPGILDHPLEEMNTIEMQSITALAHLRACVLFFIDISEQCGYSITEQVKLLETVKPLFANKPMICVINKIDVIKYDELKPESRMLLENLKTEGIHFVEMSCMMDEGTMEVKKQACEKLLASRVDIKMKTNKINDVLNRITLTVPKPRDQKQRTPFIPESVKSRMVFEENDPNRPLTEKELEQMNGGAGVYNIDLKKKYILSNDEWKYDPIPEIIDGKNVADFIDPDIEAKLLALEEEEEKLIAQGIYAVEEEEIDSEEEEIREKAKLIREKKQIMIQQHRMEKGKNRTTISAKAKARSVSFKTVKDSLEKLGLDATPMEESIVKRKRSSDSDDEMQVEEATRKKPLMGKSLTGVKNASVMKALKAIQKKQQRGLKGTRGEADRIYVESKPKHLFSGKRKSGTNDRR